MDVCSSMDVQMDGELKTGWFELQLNVLPAGFWVDWCAPVLAGLRGHKGQSVPASCATSLSHRCQCCF